MLMRSTITSEVTGDFMGLFKRKGSKCWQMCFFLEGRKVRKSTKTTNKKIAQRIHDRTKWQIAESTYNPNRKIEMPFSELVDEFLEKHSKAGKKSYKRDQVIARVLKQHFRTKSIGDIGSYNIKVWMHNRLQHITRKGTFITKASVNRELAFLKTMFNFAVEWDWVDSNPAEKVKLLRGEKKRLRMLSREEIDRLIKNAADHVKPILVIALSTGMRKSEILNLKWKHIDLTNGFIRVEDSKNSGARDVPIFPFLEDELAKLRDNDHQEDYVFRRKNGKRVVCIKEAFKAALERSSITDFRFHDLRHVAASLLAAEGCDIITLKNILGHKTLAMTQRYAHLIKDKHERTRQIMQSIWQSGDTVGDTVSVRIERPSLSH